MEAAFNITMTSKSYGDRNRVCRYVNYNINRWKKAYKDQTLTIICQSPDAVTTFLTVYFMDEANEKDIMNAVLNKIEDCLEKAPTSEPYTVMYRHPGLRYEMTYENGDCASFTEYEELVR